MKRANLIKCIFDYLVDKVEATNKESILNTTTRENFENRIYTKKLALGLPYDQFQGDGIWTSSCIKYVSVSSQDSESYSISDLRFSIVNAHGDWCNLFAGEVEDKLIETVYNHIRMIINKKPDSLEDTLSNLDNLFRPTGLLNFKSLYDFITEPEAETLLKISKEVEKLKIKGLGV